MSPAKPKTPAAKKDAPAPKPVRLSVSDVYLAHELLEAREEVETAVANAESDIRRLDDAIKHDAEHDKDKTIDKVRSVLPVDGGYRIPPTFTSLGEYYVSHLSYKRIRLILDALTTALRAEVRVYDERLKDLGVDPVQS